MSLAFHKNKIFIFAFIYLLIFNSHATNLENEEYHFNLKDIIIKQIKALKSGDKNLAFSFASPNIKNKFANANNFYSMVKEFYPQIYNSKKYIFGDTIQNNNNKYIQIVKFYENEIHTSTAVYFFVKTESNIWKIDGVVIKNVETNKI